MKKLIYLSLSLFSGFGFAQIMTVGSDSVSLQDFKKENEQTLKSVGIAQTLKSTQDFLLFQQLAEEKKADTTLHFRQRMAQKIQELHDQYFFDPVQVERMTQAYVQANKIERLVHVFTLQKEPGDTTDYAKVYQDVIGGKMSMDQAISTYVKKDIEPIYIKPGLIGEELYQDLMAAKVGGYTKLHDDPRSVTFAKLVSTRPSLGYLIFGTLKYADDANAPKQKAAIYKALTSGKAFNEVTKEFGTTPNEINAGGAVMGSPSLPDHVYAALKGMKKGEYTKEPVLFNGNYFVFYIYDLVPYEVTDKTRALFRTEMLNSNYMQALENQVVNQKQSSSDFMLTNDFKTIEKSYASFKSFSNPNAIMWKYKGHTMDYKALKAEVEQLYQNLEQVTPTQWKTLLDLRVKSDLYRLYSQEFFAKPEVKSALESERKMLFSEYIYSDLLKSEVDDSEENLRRYYNANKNEFQWEEMASGRVAILSDPSLKKSIEKEIENPQKWENLKKKYEGKLNKENKILVSFQEGEMYNDAEIFTKYKVPFKKGVFSTQMSARDVVIAIDKIIPRTLMTFEEAKEDVISRVTEEKLKEILQKQRAKTPIVVPPAFMQDLERNFKK